VKRRLIISKGARRDLKEAADWHESKQSKELAVAFLEEMFRNFDEVEARPENWAVWTLDNRVRRKVVLRRFPFVIFYTLSSRLIVIRAVAHGARRPGYWR
jgi:plasmid stabilization system protein ParE